jgi:hypothetical protein
LEYFSNENIKGNRNIEFPLGIQSKKNRKVLDALNMVKSSAPSSPPEIEWVSPVSYFNLIKQIKEHIHENYPCIQNRMEMIKEMLKK